MSLPELAEILFASEQPHGAAQVRKTILRIADQNGIDKDELLSIVEQMKRAEVKPVLPRSTAEDWLPFSAE